MSARDEIALYAGELCPECGFDLEWVECWKCGGEGFDGHDCGEDTCCCLHPEENVRCDICEGYGGWSRCINGECPGAASLEGGETE